MPISNIQYQREKGIETSYVSLYIEIEENRNYPQMYYCSKCRCPVFQMEGELLTEIPGGAPIKVASIIKCPNKTCGRKYFVVGIVK